MLTWDDSRFPGDVQNLARRVDLWQRKRVGRVSRLGLIDPPRDRMKRSTCSIPDLGALIRFSCSGWGASFLSRHRLGVTPPGQHP